MSRSQRLFRVSSISGPGRRSRALPMPLSGSRPRADRLKRSIRDWLPDAVRSRPLSRRRARAPDRSRSARHGKLHRLTDLIRQQADHYGFSTFPRREIDISLKISVRKRKASRSDLSYPPVTIRLKWAYHLALMELSRTVSTNHPGFVVFDEPRQQATREISFQSLLERASVAKASKQQVIFATSESRERLSDFLATIECNFLAFDGYIVQRLS